MSNYVKRTNINGREGWVGPIRSARQAENEAHAWRTAGWTAEVLPATPEVKAGVKAWQKRVKAER